MPPPPTHLATTRRVQRVTAPLPVALCPPHSQHLSQQPLRLRAGRVGNQWHCGNGWLLRPRLRNMVSSVSDLSSRLGPSQPGELGGGAKARHRRLASRTLTASQGNAAKPGGRARRPCLRQTPLVELYSGEPALTRDAGCRSASLVWTRAQLHYLTKRQQRNVDNETTYKTSAMKQPKRSGLAWSHGRDAALLRAVSSRSSTTPTNQPHHHRYHAGLNHSASTVT